MAAKIDLYHAIWSPPSRFVRMLGRAVGAQFNLVDCDPLQMQHLTPEFLKMNPMHTIPTINDNGFVLWESRAIGHYLIEKYAPDSGLLPRQPRARAVYDQRLFFDYNCLNVFSKTMRKLFMGATTLDNSDLKQCHKQTKLLDRFLSESPYVAGDHITMVDFSAAANLITSEKMVDPVAYKHVSRWLDRIKTEIDGFEEINGPGIEFIADFIEAVVETDGSKL